MVSASVAIISTPITPIAAVSKTLPRTASNPTRFSGTNHRAAAPMMTANTEDEGAAAPPVGQHENNRCRDHGKDREHGQILLREADQ